MAYTSPFIPVELPWAYGKNYVGSPENCFEGRSFAQIIEMLRSRWLSPESTKCSAMYKSCENSMNKAIDIDFSLHNGPLSGCIEGKLHGVPSADVLKEWKMKAALCHNTDDCTDENNGDDHGFNENF